MPDVNVKELEQAKDIDGLIAALKHAVCRAKAAEALNKLGDQSVQPDFINILLFKLMVPGDVGA